MTILVTGVTGKTGRRVVESLVTRGVGVRGLVRDLERGKMATLGMAVELVLGDFDDPATVAEAATGCDGMYLVVADGKNQVRQEVDAARAAVEAGVEHIVKLSSSDADERRSYWAVAHSDIEQAIAKMDVGYSVVRPNYFMDGFLDLFKVDSSGNITMEVPIGDGKIGAIDPYDIAETSAALLAGGIPLNGHALLTGTENISMNRVADAFASVSGRKITYVSPDPATYRAALEIEGSASAGDIADIYEEVRSGTAEMVSNEVERITGTPARSIEQFASANVAAINAAISGAISGASVG
jgi:NAD(P)H dehydrogenase (quinone)